MVSSPGAKPSFLTNLRIRRSAARLSRSLLIEVGNHRDLDPGNRRHLREEHGAKLARADQTNAYWPAHEPRGELVLQAHSAAMR